MWTTLPGASASASASTSYPSVTSEKAATRSAPKHSRITKEGYRLVDGTVIPLSYIKGYECSCYPCQSCTRSIHTQLESKRMKHSLGSEACPGVGTIHIRTSTRDWLLTVVNATMPVKEVRLRTTTSPRVSLPPPKSVCCATYIVNIELIICASVSVITQRRCHAALGDSLQRFTLSVASRNLYVGQGAPCSAR